MSPATRTAPSSASTSSTRRTARRAASACVEFRAFEMPPHARMSLAQQLLVRGAGRAVLAAAVQAAAGALGHGAARPLHAAALRLGGFRGRPRAIWRSAGYRVASRVVRAALRVPLPALRRRSTHAGSRRSSCARRSSPGMCWARKARAAATARYVDCSLERLQVKVVGLLRRSPCRDLQRPDAAADADRRRTAKRWPACASGRGQPPSALHPNIPVHAPLVFDICRHWIGRSLAGCRYHVAHPGGRNYETFPVNAYEAEARRSPASSLSAHAGETAPAPPIINSDYPLTLDLRRAF